MTEVIGLMIWIGIKAFIDLFLIIRLINKEMFQTT